MLQVTKDGNVQYERNHELSNGLDAVLMVKSLDATTEMKLKAWCYLIRTGLAWRLTGEYWSVNAEGLINSGVIDKFGNLNHEAAKHISLP